MWNTTLIQYQATDILIVCFNSSRKKLYTLNYQTCGSLTKMHIALSRMYTCISTVKGVSKGRSWLAYWTCTSLSDWILNSFGIRQPLTWFSHLAIYSVNNNNNLKINHNQSKVFCIILNTTRLDYTLVTFTLGIDKHRLRSLTSPIFAGNNALVHKVTMIQSKTKYPQSDVWRVSKGSKRCCC